MNKVLWGLQVVLTVLFAVAGATKIFLWPHVAGQVASNGALPRAAWTGIGVLELVCAVLLIVPWALGRWSMLTPLAAGVLVIEGICFVALHARYGEVSPLMYSLLLAVMAAVVVYGRRPAHSI